MSREIAIRPAAAPIRGEARVPGSKSLTNRWLVVAALADGVSTLEGALASDDTRYMAEALRALGFRVETADEGRTIRVEGKGGEIPARGAEVYGGNAGTVVRFLAPVVALGSGRFRIDGSERMRQRPLGDLLAALRALGVDATSEAGTDCPPIVVEARGIDGGRVSLPGDVSSQFTSALLLAAPCARRDVEIRVTGELVSAPFVDMTVDVMRRAGVRVERREDAWGVPAPQRYQPATVPIEPDATAASYFFAAAALTGGSVVVRGLGSDSLQGDLRFVELLGEMGARVEIGADRVRVEGPPEGRLEAISRDVADVSDTFLTLAVVAAFAEGTTEIRGIGHTRRQETDRVRAVATELRRMGVLVDEEADAIRIRGGGVGPARIETYDDHRMAMSFALAGLLREGIVILDPDCVRKTFPGYFDELARLAASGEA